MTDDLLERLLAIAATVLLAPFVVVLFIAIAGIWAYWFFEMGRDCFMAAVIGGVYTTEVVSRAVATMFVAGVLSFWAYGVVTE